MQAVAMVAVVAITLGTVGVLLASRAARSVSHHGPVSGTRLASPTANPTIVPKIPVLLPTTAQVTTASRDVVWVLVADTLLFRSTDRVPETQSNGAGAEVWRTTDCAANWQRVAFVTRTQPAQTDSGLAYRQCKEALSFVDQTHGFLGAWSPNDKPTVYRTSDSGETWFGSTLPDPPGFVSQAGGGTLRVRLVRGFGGTVLALAFANGSNYVFRSTDGGGSWMYEATTVNTGTNDPTFVTPRAGW